MASSIDIVIDERFTELVADVVAKHFPDIHQYVQSIQGLVRTKLDKEGEIIPSPGMPVALKRTSNIYAACGVPPYLMIIDGSFWNSAADHEIRGMIGNALLSIEVVVKSNDEGEETVRFKANKPDVVIFTEAVRMFGAFTPGVLEIRDIAQTIATAAMGFVRDEASEDEVVTAAEETPAPQKETPEQEPEPEPPLSSTKPKSRSRSKPVSRQESEPESEWPEPPRVKSADELEAEDALLAPRTG